MESQKLLLSWDEYDSNITSNFKLMKDQNDFCDVTLISDDQTLIAAHKVLLSASSPLFMKILRNSSCKHPSLFLSGVHSRELNMVLDFIYQGSIKIQQDYLDMFMHVAQKLQIKGLTVKDMLSVKEKSVTVDEEIIDSSESDHADESEIDDNIKVEAAEKQEEYLKEPGSMNLQELDEKINDLIDEGIGHYRCKVCTKSASQRCNLKKHIETHIIGLAFACRCEKTFKTRNALQIHRQRNPATCK